MLTSAISWLQFQISAVSSNWREIFRGLAFIYEITCSKICKLKSAIRLGITLFDSGTNSSIFFASFTRIVADIYYVRGWSSAIIWGFLDFVALNATWYETINSGLSTDAKPKFGRAVREPKWALLARKDFSSWPTTLTPSCRLSKCSCGYDCFKFALEKTVSRSMHWDVLQILFFRCTWNRKTNVVIIPFPIFT